MLKKIYSFTINDVREVKEKTTEKRKNKDGTEEEVTVEKNVKKPVPFEFVLKDPSRRELEEADMEFSIEMSRCIKKGILTKAMLAKKYSDTGGLLSEGDANRLVELYSELGDLESEYAKRTITNRDSKKLSAKVRKELDSLTAKLAIARRDIVELESSYHSVFNHTADVKAQNRIVLWYIVHLTYLKENEEAEPEQFFKGASFEDRVDNYYAKEEAGDSLFNAVAGKLAALFSYWYFSNSVEEEQFDKIIDDIDNPS